MDKQEIQKEIDQVNLDIDATNQRISKLREEIAEAERQKDSDPKEKAIIINGRKRK